jgi:hypothetical protein
MAMSWGSSWEKHYSENGLAKPPKRDTRALSPAGIFRKKGAAPLSGAEKLTARAISAYAQRACLLSLQMGSIN